MANNSLSSVLAWMKEDSRMLGWGMIVALERRKANMLIAQEFIRRFRMESYLPPINGEVEIVENQRKEQIHNFVLDVPLLSFEHADANDSKAMLSMAVMGGTQITLQKESVGWKAYKVHEFDPLQGPKLYLDLLLNQVPGDVETDGRVKLDLAESDNFRLTSGQTDHEQRIGGDFFKDLFNQLPDDQRIYPLGHIRRGNYDFVTPTSFELRTQASSAASRDATSADHGNGAILALIRTKTRPAGDFPGAGYKYLIPDDDGTDYSATVLFDHKLMAVEALLQTVAEGIDGEELAMEYDPQGDLVRATTKIGRLVMPAINYDLEWSFLGTPDVITMTTDEYIFLIGEQNPLVFEVSGGEISIAWSSAVEVEATFTSRSSGMPPKEAVFNYTFDLKAKYKGFTDDEGIVSLHRTSFELNPTLVIPESAQAGQASPDSSSGEAMWAALFRFLVESTVPVLVFNAAVLMSISGMFKELFPLNKAMSELIAQTIELNFGQAIQGAESYAPGDIGFFGRINPTQTTFAIEPMRPLVKQGDLVHFTTEPAVPGVKWKVESLLGGPDDPGSINESGTYHPPSVNSGRYTRVRVTATAPDSAYFSSALVTVLVNELTVNPLIQVCDVGATVELSAGQLGTGELKWAIKNPVAGESGEVRPSDKPEGDHTYHHGQLVPQKTFVLDEIEVTSATGSTRSAHVLALQQVPGLTVGIVNIELAKGQVQLQAIINGKSIPAEWSLPLGGPGTINADGLYLASAAATERFALVFAKVDIPELGAFEGYLILPLPLIEFPALLEVTP